jgi:hypothetical protein
MALQARAAIGLALAAVAAVACASAPSRVARADRAVFVALAQVQDATEAACDAGRVAADACRALASRLVVTLRAAADAATLTPERVPALHRLAASLAPLDAALALPAWPADVQGPARAHVAAVAAAVRGQVAR